MVGKTYTKNWIVRRYIVIFGETRRCHHTHHVIVHDLTDMLHNVYVSQYQYHFDRASIEYRTYIIRLQSEVLILFIGIHVFHMHQ